MKDFEFEVTDSFSITGRGLVLVGYVFDGYKESLGKTILAIGTATGRYKVLQVDTRKITCFSGQGPERIALNVEKLK